MDINKFQPQYKQLYQKHFLSLQNISSEELCEILHYARLLKVRQSVAERKNELKNKVVALITKRAFTRSRIAFEIAVNELGGTPIAVQLDGTDIEKLKFDRDLFPVLERYGLNGIVIDTEESHDANALTNNSTVSVINANNTGSPCQALAALLSMWEKLGSLTSKKLAIIGDFSGADNSLIVGALKMGMEVSASCPEELAPSKELLHAVMPYGDINIFSDAESAIKNSDAVYLCNRTEKFPSNDFYIDEFTMHSAKPNAIFMNPLPCERDEEVDSSVIDGSQSIVYDLAENLFHIEKAVLSLLIGKPQL